MTRSPRPTAATLTLLALSVLAAATAGAHCDTLDGPVAVDARAALASGDVTPTLKWARADDEPAIRSAFAKALEVRGAGEASRELAELWFLETLVRLHREGEGAPYTGLKPAGTVEPGVAAADRALAAGDAGALIAALAGAVGDAVRVRFDRVVAAREHADHTVAGGRAYVAAYVDYVHFVEGLHTSLGSTQHGALAGNQQTHTH